MQEVLGFLSSAVGSSFPFIVVILPLAIVVVMYSLITGNTVSMTIANKKFSIGGRTEKEIQEPRPTVNIVEENHTEKELHIEKTKTIIKECQEYVFDIRQNMLLQQMNFSEEKLEELRRLICKTYSIKLAEVLGCSIIKAKEHKDYKLYRLMMYHILRQEVKERVVKKALKENHFLELSDTEFRQYKNRKMDIIIDTISEKIDTLYNDDALINRETLDKLNENIRPQTEQIILSIFDQAKQFSKDNREKISARIQETDKLLEEI